MRDNLKDIDYYKSFLNYQYERIEKKMAKLKNSDEDKKQRILISLTGYEVDLLKAEFSSGASKEDLRVLLIRAIEIVCANHKVTYDDLLTLLSLAILLNAKSDAVRLINSSKDLIYTDRLLKFIAAYIETGIVDWDNTTTIRKEYEALNQVFSADDKEEAIKKYLAGWYEAHSEYAWYNSHLRDSDTYCGYWSFESGAIAKILGIKENNLCNLNYYPTL
ncbi:PoNe immunity protein domain-containing protein [Ruminococcus flavefaciens]|uniref:PoNe immunity protein domain-containing protein n=1 Tax=Ruminococcus flavefaciens TaxID=1265 RepID=UPI0026EA0808|nr:PoNe immunity protein domain-containing protein [Ruminococcus flavefaciens]